MDDLFRCRVDKLQHLGMQAKAVHRAVIIAVTIFAVAHNRMTYRCHVHTNLIGASGLEVEFNECVIGESVNR